MKALLAIIFVLAMILLTQALEHQESNTQELTRSRRYGWGGGWGRGYGMGYGMGYGGWGYRPWGMWGWGR